MQAAGLGNALLGKADPKLPYTYLHIDETDPDNRSGYQYRVKRSLLAKLYDDSLRNASLALDQYLRDIKEQLENAGEPENIKSSLYEVYDNFDLTMDTLIEGEDPGEID